MGWGSDCGISEGSGSAGPEGLREKHRRKESKGGRKQKNKKKGMVDEGGNKEQKKGVKM